MQLLLGLLVITLGCAKVVKKTYWGEKEYEILEPSAGNYSALTWIVYGDEQTVSVDTTNDAQVEAIERSYSTGDDDETPRGRVRMKLTARADLADNNYIAIACFTTSSSKSLSSGESGFGVVTKDEASSHYFQELTTIEATGEKAAKAVDTDSNGWDMVKSETTGGGLSSTYEYTLYAKERTKNIGISTKSEVKVMCFVSPPSTTKYSFASGVDMSEWNTGEAREVNTAHLSRGYYLETILSLVVAAIYMF